MKTEKNWSRGLVVIIELVLKRSYRSCPYWKNKQLRPGSSITEWHWHWLSWPLFSIQSVVKAAIITEAFHKALGQESKHFYIQPKNNVMKSILKQSEYMMDLKLDYDFIFFYSHQLLYMIRVVNSCKGLVCMFSPIHQLHFLTLYPTVDYKTCFLNCLHHETHNNPTLHQMQELLKKSRLQFGRWTSHSNKG